jgi:hypothetical protein
MTEFDAEAFIAELERMGMRLTALQLADGKFKVYRWRMQGAREHAPQIEALWNSQVGENQRRSGRLLICRGPGPVRWAAAGHPCPHRAAWLISRSGPPPVEGHCGRP